jgi:hypothetical protein
LVHLINKAWATEKKGGVSIMRLTSKQEIETYLEQKPETLQKIAIRTMEIINLSHPDIEAEMRWGKPTFGLNGDFHHWICSVQVLNNKVLMRVWKKWRRNSSQVRKNFIFTAILLYSEFPLWYKDNLQFTI